MTRTGTTGTAPYSENRAPVYLLTLLLITRLPKVNPRQLAELETAGGA